MNLKNIIHSIFLLLILSLFFGSCREDQETLYVSIDKSEVEIFRGDSCKLAIKVQDIDKNYSKEATWSVYSSTPILEGENVVTVNSSGVVKGLNYGSAIIKAQLSDGRYALSSVTVKARTLSSVDGMAFDRSDYYITATSFTDSLLVNIDSTYLKKYDISIESSNTSLLQIGSGLVPVQGEINTYKIALIPQGLETEESNPVSVTLKIGDGDKAMIQCNIHIGVQLYLSFEPVVTGLGSDVSVVEQKSYKMSINEGFEIKEDTIIVYFNSNPDYKIDDIKFNVQSTNGVLIVKKHGFADNYMQTRKYLVIVQAGYLSGNGEIIITALGSKLTAKCEIYNRKDNPVASVTLSQTNIITKNKAVDLSESIEVSPFGITDYWPIIWTSDNESIATVSDGTVLFKSLGEVNITAKAGDKYATCHIKSMWEVTSLSLSDGNKTELYVDEYTTWEYKIATNYDIYPKNRIEWSSSNPQIASIDNNGKITALAEGSSTITVSLTDDLGNTLSNSKEIIIKSQEEIDIYDYIITSDFVCFYEPTDGLRLHVTNNTDDYPTINIAGSMFTEDGIYTIGSNGISASVTYNATGVIAKDVTGIIEIKNEQISFDLTVKKGSKTVTIKGGPIDYIQF